MSYNLLALKVETAPKEKFPDGYSSQQGWWIFHLIERYIDPINHENTLWDGEIQIIYDGLCGDLKEKERQEELLSYLRDYDEDVTLQDLERLRDFLKVCIDNGYILNKWY